MHRRLLITLFAVGGLASSFGADVPVDGGRAEPLRKVAEVLSLSEAEASRSLAVRLEGVVIGEAPPVGKAFVLWDGRDSIYVRDETAGERGTFRRGDRVELEAVSGVGGFTPSLYMRAGRRLGEGAIPAPREVTSDQLLTGQCDAQWVRVRGIVRQCEPSTVWAGRWRLTLLSGGQLLTVHVNDDLRPERLVDAQVAVDGLVFNQHNMSRQSVSALLFVPEGVPPEVEVAAPADPFALPVRAVGSLLQFERNGRPGHRVHVRGQVVHQQAGGAFWIRDGARGLCVMSPQADALRAGDLVEVVGFPVQGGYTPRLADAVYRRAGSGAAPEAVAPADIRAAIAHDSDLVAIEGRLVERRRVAEGLALVLDWGGRLVSATLPLVEGEAVPPGWLPGSLVRATGICQVPADEPGRASGTWEARSFELTLRSAADLRVLQPAPWWSRERLFWGLGIALGVSALGTGLVLVLARRRLREQAERRGRAEAEFAAILSERNRVAREIHDTLAQGLAAISMRLELAKNVAAGDWAAIMRQVETAHRLTRETLAEARASIWDMRSQVLETCDLAGALEGVLRQLSEGTSVATACRVAGDRRRLAPVVEGELLRIGQEAITNAFKHAAPQHVEVALTFSEKEVELVVADDGAGFEPARVAVSGRRYGLVGIRERVAQLGAHLELVSAPGRGTRLVVRVRTPD
jgi:signal transduction histidine kinase